MKHVEPYLALRRPAARIAALLASMTLAAVSHAARTDIATTPIIARTAAQVKPNVMLLMDASNSMGRTHMPDEVETLTKPQSIGYKSSQCNVLYYNPATVYLLPKKYNGDLFPPPAFTSAPYAGFGEFYTPANTTPTNLNTSFVPYDRDTLEVNSPFTPTPQRAYYYVYTGPETLKLDARPCTQLDTGVSADTLVAGGRWTKVVVSAAEEQNFAIWYSFYRTRLALTKSAASLAFQPLNDTKRVGFITVQPKASRGDPGIDGTTGNWPRYLPIADFGDLPGGQKEKWFSKLFSQAPGGTSPAREGLARVGRHYAGKEDGINTNMPATGLADPVKYSCQQNFTILTTDGYWNGQDETRGSGLYGGGLQLNGTDLVGQQDGDLSDPYSPRPFWDGASDSIRVVTNKVNAYTDNACSIGGRYRSTYQTQREVVNLTADTTRTTKRTVQFYEAKSQAVAATLRTTRTETSDVQSTEQFVKERTHYTEERYKHVRWQEQTRKVTQQHELQTRQTLAQTMQTIKTEKRIRKIEEQWWTSKSQSVETTTQYMMQVDRYMLGRRQTYMHQYQTIEKRGIERGEPISGECVPETGVVICSVNEVLENQLVDPALCEGLTPGQIYVDAGRANLKTVCTVGPQARAYGPVSSCTPTFTAATESNDWVETKCDLATGPILPSSPFAGVTQYGTPTAINGTCVDGLPTQDGSLFIYTCTRPSGTNKDTPVAACGSYPPASSPNWITTTCGQPAGDNNFAARPSLPCSEGAPVTDLNYVTTTCTKPVNTPPPGTYVASCTDDPGTTGPSYLKVTCVPEPITSAAVPSTACTPSTVGLVITTCTTSPAGPYATPRPVPLPCVDGATSGDPNYYETKCTPNNTTAFVTAADCGAPGLTSGTDPEWTDRNCTVINGDVFADPRTCTPNDGSSAPFLRTTCTTTPTPEVVTKPSDCPLGTTYGDSSVDFVVTHCDKRGVAPPTDVLTCIPNTGEDPPYIVTTCGNSTRVEPVLVCAPGPLPDEGADKVVCVRYYTPPTPVPVCDPQIPVAGNDYKAVNCAGPTTTPAVVVDPASCVAPAYGETRYFYSEYFVTCSNSAFGAYATPTPVASCTDSYDVPTMVTKVCTFPAANNTPPQPSAPCTDGAVTVGADEIRTTCSKYDSGTNFVPTADCPGSVPQSGTGPEITCNTSTTLGTPVTACQVGDVMPVATLDTIAACHPTVTSPLADFAGVCTDGPTGVPGEVVRCARRQIDNLVSDSACVDNDGSSTGGLVTECSSFPSGTGHLYTVQTTTTVKETPYSGSVPSGPGPAPLIDTTPATQVDGVCYPTPQSFTAQPVPPPPGPGTTCAAGPAYPCVAVTPTAGGSLNSLADVAQYYYKTDLRPSMTNDPLRGGVPPAGTGPEDDKASHQHMTTFVVGIGVSGTLNFRPDYKTATTGDFADIRSGAKNWPVWPNPLLTFTDPDEYNTPRSIDDFWHTAVNGRGRYFSATNPRTVIQGLADALADTGNRLASGTADSVSTLQPTSTNNFAYSTSFTSGLWEGDLQARVIDVSNGVPGDPVWKAKDLLGPRQLDTCDDRDIYLMRGSSALLEFRWNTKKCVAGVPTATSDAAFDATEVGYLGAAALPGLTQWRFMTPAQQAAASATPGVLVNFLRGQRANEGFEIDSTTKFFRKRGAGPGDGYLGDIVDSQPVYVGQPFANYLENDYTGFKGTSRKPMIYVGANDGMLHAFFATVDLSDPEHGREAWAVIPSTVLPNLYRLADDDYKRDGHQFYVNATPVAGDVWDSTVLRWKTILVGGLGAGGKGYYALDVSNPGARPIPLWEFKEDSTSCPAPSNSLSGFYADCNVGLSFGKPIITKIAGQWRVLVTSGYNNADGKGYLYVLDAMTGEMKQKIATTRGSPGNPSGLAQVNNYVDNVVIDNTSLRAYGGDVHGNIWRFDFNSPTATLLGTATDTLGNVQPITVRPELAELDGRPFVLVGTGRFLGGDDVTDRQKQSVYGIRDTLGGPNPIADPLRDVLRPMAINQTGAGSTAVRTVRCSVSGAACDRTAGWVLDLPEEGERVNVEMKLVLGALVFASNVPALEPCSVGGHSWFNQVDFRTAGPIPGATATSEYLADSLNVGFNVLQLPLLPGQQNPTYTGLFRQSNASNANRPVTPPEPGAVGRRITWREIATQ